VRFAPVLELEHYLDVLERKPGALAGSTPLAQCRARGLWPANYDALWARLIGRHGKQAGTRQMIGVLQGSGHTVFVHEGDARRDHRQHRSDHPPARTADTYIAKLRTQLEPRPHEPRSSGRCTGARISSCRRHSVDIP
jgi:hypothetical protein